MEHSFKTMMLGSSCKSFIMTLMFVAITNRTVLSVGQDECLYPPCATTGGTISTTVIVSSTTVIETTTSTAVVAADGLGVIAIAGVVIATLAVVFGCICMFRIQIARLLECEIWRRTPKFARSFHQRLQTANAVFEFPTAGTQTPVETTPLLNSTPALESDVSMPMVMMDVRDLPPPQRGTLCTYTREGLEFGASWDTASV